MDLVHPDSNSRAIMLVDGLNLFIRSYSAYPTMSAHGYSMGGTIGFLKTLGRLIADYNPERVIIAWEGGGSPRRRSIYPDYKNKKRALKLNRFYEDDLPDSEENNQHQIKQLVKLLNCTKLEQIYVENCEADDVIAYICSIFKKQSKIIVTSDRDLYQLLDDNTTIYSLYKKIFVTKESLENEFSISSNNFALAKSLCGDISDNIKGVPGLGFKKLTQLFPQLKSESPILLEDLIKYCYANRTDKNFYQKIIENNQIVNRNWKLVYLDNGNLSYDQIKKLDNYLNSSQKKPNDRSSFMKILANEGINNFNISEFFYSLNAIK